MSASWIRREFGAVGLTQYPPGRQLEAVQREFGGRALLCIDVSGSMTSRLQIAVEGGLDFLREAEEAHYACGVVLWNHSVEVHLPTTAPSDDIREALRGARSSGGTQLAPALRAAIAELGPLGGDRVVCLFGDGGIGDPAESERLGAEARALGIRFVVRGLGEQATASLSRVLTPDITGSDQTVKDVADLRRGIASMASEVRAGRR